MLKEYSKKMNTIFIVDCCYLLFFINRSERECGPAVNNEEGPCDVDDNCDAKCDASKDKPLSIHNIFMDVVIR